MLGFAPRQGDHNPGNSGHHQIPHTAVRDTNISYFHIGEKQEFPSQRIQEKQAFKEEGLQHLIHSNSLGELDPIGKQEV